ncbi:MAG: hypothetical protein JWR08_260 [Enterovirga sp.]|nr:hypothetical protein [Enterovirga sp.]
MRSMVEGAPRRSEGGKTLVDLSWPPRTTVTTSVLSGSADLTDATAQPSREEAPFHERRVHT